MKKSALEKRIKRKITGRQQTFFAACSPGFKSLCQKELLALGLSEDLLTIQPGGVEFNSRPDLCMRAGLSLKMPLRILMRLNQFKATSFSQLKDKISAMDWAVYLPPTVRLNCHVTTKKSRLYHSDAIAQRVKEAVLNQLDPTENKMQSPGPEQTLYIRAENDRFEISIDTTGGHLFKRGIKTRTTPAPLRENIAAAMLSWTGLSPDDRLIDPMCGSGTFSLEAAMIMSNTPPGLYRSFAFETLPGFSSKTFAHLKKEAVKQVCQIKNNQIFASDIDERAIQALKQNAAAHDFTQAIQIRKTDFFSIDPDELCSGQKGVIALNPPYGKRLDQHRTSLSFYKEIKKKLLADFKGWRVTIILPSTKDMAQLDLKLKQHPVFHGGMDACAGTGLI